MDNPPSNSASAASNSPRTAQPRAPLADAADRQVRAKAAALGAEADLGQFALDGVVQRDHRFGPLGRADPDGPGPADVRKSPGAKGFDVEGGERLDCGGNGLANIRHVQQTDLAQELHRPVQLLRSDPASL